MSYGPHEGWEHLTGPGGTTRAIRGLPKNAAVGGWLRPESTLDTGGVCLCFSPHSPRISRCVVLAILPIVTETLCHTPGYLKKMKICAVQIFIALACSVGEQ
jgi:hypothetical protein